MTTVATMPAVDPALEAIIQRAGAPVAAPPLTAPPKEMPGERGLLNGVRFLFDVLGKGVDAYAAKREQYGDIHRVQFVLNQMVMVWDADAIHKITRNEDKLWSTALGWDALMFERLDPRGNIGALLSFDFEDHREARKLVNSAFTMKAVDGYLAIAGRAFEEAIPLWIAAGRVDFKAEARTLLARVATELFTGITDPREAALVDRTLVDFWKGVMAVSRNAWVSPAHRRSRKALQTLTKMFLALVPARREQPGTDLFSHMCQVVDEDGLGDEAMVRVFITVMAAAFDTTAAGLASMAYLLAKHPEWQERLRKEAQSMPDGAIDYAAMKGMQQTEWAWKETLRVMPVANLLPRVALRDVELGGFNVRAGTLIMAMSIGRHPKWWKNPTVFDPERFSPERAEDKQHPAIFLPFGAGAHACVGMQLANMEVKLFWHKLLTRCSFSLETDYVANHTIPPIGIVSGDVALKLVALP